jgi:hypothetical protein
MAPKSTPKNGALRRRHCAPRAAFCAKASEVVAKGQAMSTKKEIARLGKVLYSSNHPLIVYSIRITNNVSDAP